MIILPKPGIGPLEDWASRLVLALEDRLTRIEQSIQGLDERLTLIEAMGTPEQYAPELKFGGNNVGMTYAVHNAAFITLKGLVYVSGYIELTNKGSSTGTATINVGIDPLPDYNYVGNIDVFGGTSIGAPFIIAGFGLDEITIFDADDPATDVDFNNNAAFVFSMVYMGDPND